MQQDFSGIWQTASPYGHYRPVFGSWLWLLDHLLPTRPAVYALVGCLPILLTLFLTYRLVQTWLPSEPALWAALLACLHPLRQPHYFWMSGQIDSWLLVFQLLILSKAARILQQKKRSWSSIVMIAVGSMLAYWIKETSLLLIPLVLLFPGLGRWRTRWLPALAVALGSAIAVAVARLVMGHFGRGGTILHFAGWQKVIHYPFKLIWPVDLRGLKIAAQQSGDYLPLYGYLFLILLAFLLIFMVLRKNRKVWLYAALLFIAAGACVAVVDNDSRGLALGVVGISVLLAGWVHELEAVSARFGIPSIFLFLMITWGGNWIKAERAWREAKQYSMLFTQTISRVMDRIGRHRMIVMVNSLESIQNTAWCADMSLYPQCGVHLQSMNTPTLYGTVQAAISDSSCVFNALDQAYFTRSNNASWTGIVNLRYGRAAYPTEFTWIPDKCDVNFWGCGEAVYLFWDGQGFREWPLPVAATPETTRPPGQF